MADVFDYLEWRGDVPFDADPFNEVDNLILAEVAYTDFDGIVPSEGRGITLRKACERFFEKHDRDEIRRSDNPIARAPLLMDGMLTGRRLGDITLNHYVNIIDAGKDIQMSAVTFRLSDGTAYVAFRGTDSTIVGWKEDFNMSYQPETEGQRRAVEYLNEAGRRTRCPLRVGGHSKGGNFAVYASAFCNKKIRDRILQVYTNDGPGFRSEFMNSGEYLAVLPKVISIVPDTSVIGMLLTSKVEHHVVASSASGLMQHDGMTWQVERNQFVPAELSDLGKFIREMQSDWLSKIDDTTRESFVNTLFYIFEATGFGTFGEMNARKLRSAERMITTMTELPRDKQRELLKIFGELLQSGGQIVFDSVSDIVKQ